MMNTIIVITIITAISIILTEVSQILTTIIAVMIMGEIAAHYHPKTITKTIIHPEIPISILIDIEATKIDRVVSALANQIPVIIPIEIVAPGTMITIDILAKIAIPIDPTMTIVTILPVLAAMILPVAHPTTHQSIADFALVMVTI